MSTELKIKKNQTIAGLLLFAFIVVFSIYLGGNFAVSLITGVVLGYILTRSRYGFAGGIKRIYITGEGSLSKALLIMFAISIVTTTILHWTAAANGQPIPGISSVHFLNISTILGGFLFGIGMMIAGGCASGTLSDLGEGAVRALITLIFFIIGSIPGLETKYILDNSAIGRIGARVYLPDVLGYIGAAILSLILLFGLYLLTKKYEAFRKKEGFYQKTVYEDAEKPLPKEISEKSGYYGIYHKLFVQRWSFVTGGILLAIMFVVIQWTTGHSWGVTGGFTNWGVAVFQKLGMEFNSPAFETTVKIVNNGLLKDTIGLRNMGIILGAALAFLMAGRFYLDIDFNWKDAGYYIIGGLIMGFGARLAGGCNIGALYSGIGNFSLAGWIYFVALSLGGIVGLKLFEGKVNIIPPNRHKKEEA